MFFIFPFCLNLPFVALAYLMCIWCSLSDGEVFMKSKFCLVVALLFVIRYTFDMFTCFSSPPIHGVMSSTTLSFFRVHKRTCVCVLIKCPMFVDEASCCCLPMFLTLFVNFLNCAVPTIKVHVDYITHLRCLRLVNSVICTGSHSTELYCHVFFCEHNWVLRYSWCCWGYSLGLCVHSSFVGSSNPNFGGEAPPHSCYITVGQITIVG